MRIRFDIWTKERDEAAVLDNGLKLWWELSDTGSPRGMLFMPKAIKPLWSYRFRTVEQLENYFAEAVNNYDAAMAYKVNRRAEKKAAVQAGDMSLVAPGSVFCYSWGYDQTNVEYWQVVSRSGQMVTLREIACEQVPDSGYSHGMADNVRPAIDAFLTECAVCHNSKRAIVHDIIACAAGEFGHNASEYHEYVPGYKEIRKRVQFSGGTPGFRMDFGWLSPVKVARFGNADPITAHTHYRSWYH